jgi:hypothetical protein
MTLAARLGALISAIGVDIKAALTGDINAGTFAAPLRDITHRRVTRAQLETLAENLELITGQIYIITDESARLAVAINTAVYSTFVREGEGADGFTNVILGADFVTSSAAAVDTGIAVAVPANARIMFEARLLVRTAVTTVGPRPGIAWPTGMTDGSGSIAIPASLTSGLQQHGNVNAAVLIGGGGLPVANASYLATMNGLMITGGAPGGSFRVQLASETAGTNVTIKAGSFLRWKPI